MLRAVATSAAQVRAAATATREANLTPLDLSSRPRALVVTGMGGSGVAGDVLAAIAGLRCPVPIVVHRGNGLPGWVGAADVVVAVSCSGTTAETLSATVEAARRGTRLLGVGGADSPLQDRCLSGGGAFVAVSRELSPRSSLWGLATPLLVVGARLGLVDLGPEDAALEAAAAQLESAASLCAPDRESFVNPGKTLAAELAESLPMVWGAGQVGPVAATRLMTQLAENAKLPAIAGALPEAHHNQVVALDGPLAAGSADDDLFRDRVEDAVPLRLRLVVLRDDDPDDDDPARRADVSASVAAARGVPVTVVSAQGESPVERLASLVGVVDYASVYLALAQGIDPTPIQPIVELKHAMSEPRTL